ncbi:hypothetical protein WJX81_003715 [Elliptochloris bilobata]|uniref:Intraflagellar transport protein 122 homolog n=1 Tax=Elliptochloris bilobata TaxID=381761 RepID=A0AAW1QXR5_9CHLO
MRSTLAWSEEPLGVDGACSDCTDLAYSPDGEHLVVAAGVRVLVYAAASGELLHSVPVQQRSQAASRHKLPGTAVAAAWSASGRRLALLLAGGGVNLRERSGTEAAALRMPAPATALAWRPPMAAGADDVLAVARADGLLALHGPSARALNLHPGGSHVAVAAGGRRGGVAVYSLAFTTVHGLHRSRYASRATMTDIVVQDLAYDARAMIACGALVRKVAVYARRLAVLLPGRLLALHYTLVARVDRQLECNLLVATDQHLVLCQDCMMEALDWGGATTRTWALDAPVRYVRCVGGPPGREGLLAGLRSGAVLMLFIDRDAPVPLFMHDAPVRCLDLSAGRGRVAVVDDASLLSVYCLATRARLWGAPGAASAAWNSVCDDMLAWSGGGCLSMRTADFPPHRQPMQGFVVGFSESRVYCLHQATLQALDVPHSATLAHFLALQDFRGAYQVACLGVTEADWRALGWAAARALQLGVARAAWARLRDAPLLEALHRLAAQRAAGLPDAHAAAAVLALQGCFSEAADAFAAAGAPERALDLLADMRMFSEARAFAARMTLPALDAPAEGGAGPGPAEHPDGAGKPPLGPRPADNQLVARLRMREGEWLEQERQDLPAAAAAYAEAGDAGRGVALLASHARWDALAQLAQGLDLGADVAALRVAGEALRGAGHDGAHAALSRLGDVKARCRP